MTTTWVDGAGAKLRDRHTMGPGRPQAPAPPFAESGQWACRSHREVKQEHFRQVLATLQPRDRRGAMWKP